MFSKIIFKKTLRENWKLWLGITLGLCLMLTILLLAANSFTNNPRFAEHPERAEGVGAGIIEQYYSFFAVLLPLIYIVITGNKLVAAQVDKGSLACVMARPIKRGQFSVTQAVYLIGSVIAMFAAISAVGVVVLAATGLDLSIGTFLLFNLGAVLLHLALSGISYLASCIFNFSGKSLLLGAGLPILFFVFRVMDSFSDLADIMKMFKYLTINSLFDTADVAAHSANMIWKFAILFVIGAVCYISGAVYFNKKDLPV